jgi:hypothetical protein
MKSETLNTQMYNLMMQKYIVILCQLREYIESFYVSFGPSQLILKVTMRRKMQRKLMHQAENEEYSAAGFVISNGRYFTRLLTAKFWRLEV